MQKSDTDMLSCLQDIVGSTSVNKTELLFTKSQHLEELAVSFGE